MNMKLSPDEGKFIVLMRTAEKNDFPLYVALSVMLSRPICGYSKGALQRGIKKLRSLQVLHPQCSDDYEDAISSIRCELNRRREVAKERGTTA